MGFVVVQGSVFTFSTGHVHLAKVRLSERTHSGKGGLGILQVVAVPHWYPFLCGFLHAQEAYGPANRLRAGGSTTAYVGRLHWEALGVHGNIFVRWIALTWLFLLRGALRFAHVQRSSEFLFSTEGAVLVGKKPAKDTKYRD